MFISPLSLKLSYQPRGSRRPHPPAGALLDRVHPAVLHLFHHAGVLLHALLPGSGPAAGIGHGRRRKLDPLGNARAHGDHRDLRRSRRLPSWSPCAMCPLRETLPQALSNHPTAYKLSLGHMEDLTLNSFAYLRFPLALAAIAFLVGAVGTLRAGSQRAFLAIAVMMVLFFQAARLAMVAFDPFLSSRPLAQAILKSPPGSIIVDSQYYIYSSIAYYTGRPELLLNGRWNNLEYGSYAPGAPNVFINDAEFKLLWLKPARYYLVTKGLRDAAAGASGRPQQATRGRNRRRQDRLHQLPSVCPNRGPASGNRSAC